MRFFYLLSLLACAALLACGQEQAPTASGPAGKVSADCTLAEIFSGKEGCAEDPSLDEVPAGYVAPSDSTETAVEDTVATAPADTVATAPAAPPDTPEPVVSLSPEAARAALESLGIEYTAGAFIEAAKVGNLDVVHLFVWAGMDIEATDHWGDTALHRAASWGRLSVVEFLVGAGASLTATTNGGTSTPLHLAAWWGRLAVVEFLVGAGADVTATTNDGETPRDRAAECSSRTDFTDGWRARCRAVVAYFDSLDDDE